MAKATKNEVVAYTVTLEMTDREAEVLLNIMEKIGGDGTRSPRADADAIAEALRDAGVRLVKLRCHEKYDQIHYL
jgi:type II secretory pathway component PulM